MHVASLELCKELYELSGWQVSDDSVDWYTRSRVADGPMFMAPKYSLGYLLRKLPLELKMSRLQNGDWSFRSSKTARVYFIPEDAACKLAIELFRQGVLTR